jgi:hypothetical protein
MSIFCRHKLNVVKSGMIWCYDYHFGYSNSTFYYDEMRFKIVAVCSKCGAIKIFKSKPVKFKKWKKEMNLDVLNEAERKSFEIKKNILLQKCKKVLCE